MKTTLLAVAAVGALGLAACQPAAEPESASATDSGADTSAMAPADGAMAPDEGTMTPDTMDPNAPATGTNGTMNPDGTMTDGAANPASPPPIVAPDGTGAPPPVQ